MNRRRLALGLACAFLALPVAAFGADAPAPSGMPSASEAPFVAQVQKTLMAAYPTAADAVKAGYVRYTDEDKSGSISYANDKWTSTYPNVPSQLWYDAKGNLLGADYSVEKANYPAGPPADYHGITDKARWIPIEGHIHYGIAQPDGTTKFGGLGAAAYAAAGGDVNHPTAAVLVKALAARAKNPIVAKASDVKFVFLYRSIWDLQVWVKPNANGAFAELNPAVTPSAKMNPNAEH
jgi:hypothetical protein